MWIVLGGNDPAHYAVLEEAGPTLPEVTHVAERVRVFVGEEQERAFRSAPSARVGGPTPRRQRDLGAPRGAPRQPFGWADVERKAYRVAESAVRPRTVDQMVAAVRSWGQDDVPVAGTLP